MTQSNGSANIAVALVLMAASYPGTGWGQETVAAWLNSPKPASWNRAGASIPSAPRAQDPIDPRCRTLARPAELEQDKLVRDAGWDLFNVYQGGWQILVIHATASYDGMCRPWHYQAFVFVRGVFAGTLSPQSMDSRTDGALDRVTLENDHTLSAAYRRYAPADPLCCPSKTTTVDFEIAKNPPVVRPVSTSTSSNH